MSQRISQGCRYVGLGIFLGFSLDFLYEIWRRFARISFNRYLFIYRSSLIRTSCFFISCSSCLIDTWILVYSVVPMHSRHTPQDKFWSKVPNPLLVTCHLNIALSQSSVELQRLTDRRCYRQPRLAIHRASSRWWLQRILWPKKVIGFNRLGREWLILA